LLAATRIVRGDDVLALIEHDRRVRATRADLDDLDFLAWVGDDSRPRRRGRIVDSVGLRTSSGGILVRPA
jgi:predicted ABC-class ATPase